MTSSGALSLSGFLYLTELLPTFPALPKVSSFIDLSLSSTIAFKAVLVLSNLPIIYSIQLLYLAVLLVK